MDDDAWDRYDGGMAQLEAQAANLLQGDTYNARARLEGLVQQQCPRFGKERRHYLVASLMVRLRNRAPPERQAEWERVHREFPPYGSNF